MTGTKKTASSYWVIYIAAAAYSFYSLVTESGPVSWLNYIQQSAFGSYDEKLSLVLTLAALMVIAGLSWGYLVDAWRKLFSRGGDKAVSTAGNLLDAIETGVKTGPASGPPAPRSLLLIAIIGLAAIWSVGYAIFWWIEREHWQDAVAHYEPIELGDATALTQPLRASHVALRGGRVLETVQVTHSTGTPEREDYRLVPVVSRGWARGQPVNFVLKIEGPWEIEDLKPPPAPFHARPADAEAREPDKIVIMARVEGAVPFVAAQEFRKIGAPIGENNYLLKRLETRDGKVVDFTQASDIDNYYIACGLLSVILCLITGMVFVIGLVRGLY